MINDKYELIFIHIPRTGGMSIKKALEDFTDNHQDTILHPHVKSNEIKKQFPKKYKEYKKFTVIRNPYDRMMSWYSYLHEDLNVNKFKLWLNEENPLFLPQYDWIDNTVEIIRFESLNEEMHEFLKKNINTPMYIPAINESMSRDYEYLEFYDQEALDMVYDNYKIDFEKFNYKKQ